MGIIKGNSGTDGIHVDDDAAVVWAVVSLAGVDQVDDALDMMPSRGDSGSGFNRK